MAGKIHLPHPEIVSKWKEEKVIKWLKRVHLDDCIPAFEVRHIDGTKLLDLTEQKLFTYQDMKIKHRKQIAKCVQECKSQASNAKRIAQTIKQTKHKSHPEGINSNGCYVSDDYYDSDDWGSDFEDENDEEVKIYNQIAELNNNTIIQSISYPSEQNVSPDSSHLKSNREKLIPQPPDVPLVTKSINGSIGGIPNHTKTIPRPPIKRPLGQPPPPPIPLVSSQNHEPEDYEIPIGASTPSTQDNSEHSDCSMPSVTSCDFAAETYEIIEPPEETYEMVDAPAASTLEKKPVLPPRMPLLSGAGSPPPPLPQKPKKLSDSFIHERPEGVRTFSRPKPPKTDPVEPIQSAASSIGFIGTLMGRRPSNPYTSSPKTDHKSKDLNEGTLSHNHSIVSSCDNLSSKSSSPEKDASSSTSNMKKTSSLSSLPPRGSSFDETAQNMATRPLPPVPVTKEQKSGSQDKLPEEDLKSYPWFHEIERQTAEEVIKELGETGSFVVRPSKRAGIENPYSITILHDNRLFHLNIRIRPDKTFALGKEKKIEKTFPTVPELIAFHQTDPIILRSQGEPAGKTILCKYPQKT